MNAKAELGCDAGFPSGLVASGSTIRMAWCAETQTKTEQRAISSHTAAACRDAFVSFVDFAQKRLQKQAFERPVLGPPSQRTSTVHNWEMCLTQRKSRDTLVPARLHFYL
jgi:hypothetical protein